LMENHQYQREKISKILYALLLTLTLMVFVILSGNCGPSRSVPSGV